MNGGAGQDRDDAGGRSRRQRLAVMLSGSGRTLVNLAERMQGGSRLGRLAQIGLVIASRECLGTQRARGLGLPTQVVAGEIPSARLGAVLTEAAIDWVVLAGYLKLINIPRGREGRFVNIHPALLPAFGGPGMYGRRVHEAVLAAGCKVSGCSVHLCDELYDHGPIVMQRTCRVEEDDDTESLAACVFALECEAYPEALELLLTERVRVEGRRARILAEDEANQKRQGASRREAAGG